MIQEDNFSDFQSRIDMSEIHQDLVALQREISKVIVGQNSVLEHLLAALLSGGHILIEGVPGVAKTVMAKLLSKTLSVDFSRIQFTPDLMPSDILGTSVFNVKTSEFEFKKGPIFSNFVLIDEINRSPAKTQSALFEVMEERQITIDGKCYTMQNPFLVVATQNPLEHEGTYRLPEAQLDRFLFKIEVGYPNLEQEIEIIHRQQKAGQNDKMNQVGVVLSAEKLIHYQNITKQIFIEPHLVEYIAKIVLATRQSPYLYLGASPRASLALLSASKAFAVISGRDFVTPEDIKKASLATLRHRIILSPEREMEGLKTDDVISQILDGIEIPR